MAALQAGEDPRFKLEAIDFGRRMATERELKKDAEAPMQNAVFDESGNFIIYATLLGIKVVNIVTNRLSRLVGKVENSERFLRVALYQVRCNASLFAPALTLFIPFDTLCIPVFTLFVPYLFLLSHITW